MGMLAEVTMGKPHTAVSECRWHIVHTKANMEWPVHRLIRSQGLQSLLLHKVVIWKHARQVGESLKPVYPRYLFAGVYGDGDVYTINRMPGVSTVIWGPGGPYRVPEFVIEQERAKADEYGCLLPVETTPFEAKHGREPFPEGQTVEITEGPFTSFPGTIVLDEGRQIRVEAYVFGRLVEIVMSPSGVRAVSPRRRSFAK